MDEQLFATPQRPSRRHERNEPFEALAEETGTDWNTGRGELNASLKLIRAEAAGCNDHELAEEIHVRARLYRTLMPTVLLTPTALAKHWRRVKDNGKPTRVVVNCATCNNDRLVPTGMNEYGTETYMRCPDCCPAPS